MSQTSLRQKPEMGDRRHYKRVFLQASSLLLILVSLSSARQADGRHRRDDTGVLSDVNECTSLSACGQVCHNTHGSFFCSCLDGYELQTDKWSCKAKGAKPYALYAHGTEVRRIDLEGTQFKVVARKLENVTAVDFHYQDGFAYYLDTNASVIGKAKLDGSEADSPTVIVSGVPGAVSLSLDWISNVLYWTDSHTKKIEKADADGSNRDTFLSLGPDTPGALVVDPVNKFIFWTDVETSEPKIERANLTGGDRQVIANTSLFQPFSLTLDYVDRRLFFGDNNQIESMDLDGSNRKILPRRQTVNAFAMSQFEQSVFWTDLSTSNIHRVNKYDGTDHVTIVARGPLQPYDLHVVHELRQPLSEPEQDECALGKDGCDQYCVNTIGSYFCRCYSGYVLNSDRRTCSELANCTGDNGGCSHRCVAGTDGSSVCDCPSGFNLLPNGKDCKDINECVNMSSGCSHSCVNTIGSFRCICPADTVLGRDGLTCEGCSIDNGGCQQVCVTAPGSQSFHCLCHGNYQLTNGKKCRAKGPQPYLLFANNYNIKRMNFDGTGYKTIKSSLYRTFALGIHYQRGKVYYATQPSFSFYKDMYELDLATSSVKKVLSNSKYLDDPFHIAVDWVNDKVYWTDKALKSIVRVDINGSNPMEIMKVGNPRGIAVDPYLGKLYWTDGGNMSHHPAVYESNLDGSDAREFFSGGLSQPNAVAIDFVENRLYWGDGVVEAVWYADLDGNNTEMLRNGSTTVGKLYGLTQFEEYIWWTDQSGDYLRRAPKRVTAAKDDVKISGGYRYPSAIEVVHPFRQPEQGFRSCLLNRGGCSHLCKPSFDSYVCECPEGFSLELDNHTCKELPLSPTPTTPSCIANCSGSFKGISSDVPIFSIPPRQKGLLNPSSSTLQYNGHDVQNCVFYNAVYQVECSWIDVPHDVVYAHGANIVGQNIDDHSTWSGIEDKLIRLTVKCDVSMSGTVAVEQFCVLFKITLVAAAPPTTQSPTTQSSTTQSPTTQSPTTEPTTQSPTTQSPTTQSPTTQSPTTEPTTQSPTTLSPTTLSPTTQSPTTEPTTQSPTTQSPTTLSPTTQSPTTEPTTQSPTTQSPTTQSPTTQSSTTEPTTPSPTTQSTTTVPTTPTADPCTVSNGGCSDICSRSTSGSSVTCSCTTGRKLQEDMKTCVDCQCKNGATECNSVSGKCDCPEGYNGTRCELACPHGTYGKECAFKCTCENGALCELEDGFCNCEPGWTGENCTEVCSHDKYGAFCNMSCKCENGATCEPAHGKCFCASGFTGEYCDTAVLEECDPGHCLNGGSCSKENNVQSCQCTVFWEGDRCDSPRPIPGVCFGRQDISIEECIKLFDSGALSNTDSEDDSTGTKNTVYVAVGVMVPMVTVAAIAIFIVLYRRFSQKKERSRRQQADTTILQNPTYGELLGLGSSRCEGANFDNPTYVTPPNNLLEKQPNAKALMVNPIYNPSNQSTDGQGGFTALASVSNDGQSQSLKPGNVYDKLHGGSEYATVGDLAAVPDPGYEVLKKNVQYESMAGNETGSRQTTEGGYETMTGVNGQPEDSTSGDPHEEEDKSEREEPVYEDPADICSGEAGPESNTEENNH